MPGSGYLNRLARYLGTWRQVTAAVSGARTLDANGWKGSSRGVEPLQQAITEVAQVSAEEVNKAMASMMAATKKRMDTHGKLMHLRDGLKHIYLDMCENEITREQIRKQIGTLLSETNALADTPDKYNQLTGSFQGNMGSSAVYPPQPADYVPVYSGGTPSSRGNAQSQSDLSSLLSPCP